MNCLVISERECDFCKVLESCGAEVVRMTQKEALGAELGQYGSFCVLAWGKVLDPRLRVRLEKENAKGKRIFTEALNSWLGIYSAEPADTTRMRLVVLQPEEGPRIPGLEPGDLLDDEANGMMQPWYPVPGLTPLLVYKDHIIAHGRLCAERDEILRDSRLGLWTIGDTVMMASFRLHDFNKARFAPRDRWWKLISFLAEWITGGAPSFRPEPVVRYGTEEDLSDAGVFERCRKEAIRRGIRWLGEYLVDGGRGGIREGLRHGISPEGVQAAADTVRTDCTGEAAGAFRMYGRMFGDGDSAGIADRLDDFVFGPMTVRDGPFGGMLRWTDTAWQVCYQDDAARAILPVLYECRFTENRERFPAVCRALDFLVKTTAKDGCRVARTDAPHLTEDGLLALREAEHGLPSAHYNAYYHAALLLAYRVGGNRTYLDVGRKGLETIMALYPDTRREQSETEEMCRLILPLAALYDATREEKHRAMLFKVTEDLLKHKHPSGGFYEWDTGYKANCSRESRGECSLLTENGDPVADLLYSTNWLPIGFAYAYLATGDGRFKTLWREVVSFCIRSQVRSADPKTDGSWCRAFDLDLGEAYGCPHDVGWAAYCSESGWTDAEILMGMMMPEYMGLSGFDA